MAADDPADHVDEHALARRLRDAYRRVRALDISDDVRRRLSRRLLAICDVAKRDLLSAERRLSSFQEDLSRHAEWPEKADGV